MRRSECKDSDLFLCSQIIRSLFHFLRHSPTPDFVDVSPKRPTSFSKSKRQIKKQPTLLTPLTPDLLAPCEKMEAPCVCIEPLQKVKQVVLLFVALLFFYVAPRLITKTSCFAFCSACIFFHRACNFLCKAFTDSCGSHRLTQITQK